MPRESSTFTFSDADARDAAAWDAFVESHPDVRFSHLWGYRRVLENAYRYRTVYVRLFLDSQWAGVFPAIVAPRRRRLVSQPFVEYGGPLLAPSYSKALAQLPPMLSQVAAAHGSRTIEVRGGVGLDAMVDSEYCTRHPLHQWAELPLTDPKIMWRSALTHEARKAVNKANAAKLRTEVRRGRSAVSEPFFDLHAESMKRLGVPPHARRFFNELGVGLGDKLVAAWVFRGDEVLSVLLGAISGQRLQIFITGSVSHSWADRPNDLAHWELISWAAKNGLHTFDFGSARYAGQVQFKRKWGVELRPYAYFVIGKPGSREMQTVSTMQTSSRAVTTVSKLWERFMPLGVARVVGPHIRRYLTK